MYAFLTGPSVSAQSLTNNSTTIISIVNTAFQSESIVIEGEFTQYTLKWTATFTNLTLAELSAVSGERVFFDDNFDGDAYVRKLSDGTSVDSDNFGFGLGQGDGRYTLGSVLNRYVVRKVAANKFEVWKNGVLLQTITLPDANASIRGLGISPTGKYILAGDKVNNKLCFYQGS